MTGQDILKEAPSGEEYFRTTEFSWFTCQASPIDDPKTILAQRWESAFLGYPDIWVAIPEVDLGSGTLT